MASGQREEDDAKAFYDNRLRDALERLWGEHLHPALFESPDEPLKDALARATSTMADGLELSADATVLEVACGVGAAARYLAQRFGCRVLATNISKRQIALGQELTDAAGLADRVTFAEADFHTLDFQDATFDCWWCQEALLHSPDKARVLAEARRVLKPGGWLVLSDLTVPASVSAADRAKIYARVQSPGMWDPEDYQDALKALSCQVVRADDWSRHVAPSYDAMHRLIEAHRADFEGELPAAELDRVLGEIRTWVEAARAGRLGWFRYLARREN